MRRQASSSHPEPFAASAKRRRSRLSLRGAVLAGTGVVLSAVVGCGSSAAAEQAQASEDITSIDDTAVKEQTIGNCWLYATAAWAESLHLNASQEQLDVSEGYWTFWHWYDQLVGGDVTAREPGWDSLTEGGWWGIAAELALRYGWMREQDFKPGGEQLTKAVWHKEAVDALKASVASGVFADPAKRRDRVAAFDELARIWKLEPNVIGDLTKVFGIGAVRDLRRGASTNGTAVRSTASLKARTADGVDVSLQDVLGIMDPGSVPSEGRRIGPHAWSEVRYQFDVTEPGGAELRRNMLGNIQHALNARLSVPVAWAVGTSTAGVYSGPQHVYHGLHESVLTDYEVEDVPGHGKLTLGTPVTDPATLEAALAPAARITKFRLKNSWGKDPFYSEEEWRQFGRGGAPPTESKPSYLSAKPGYNEVDIAYFDSPALLDLWYGPNSHFLLAAALPNQQRFSVPRRPLKRAFISFETYRASDFAHIGGVDAVCTDLAKIAGMKGEYAANLSNTDRGAIFAPDGKRYRAISLKRGTLRAKPIKFGEYPAVTQDGVVTDASYWDGIGADGTCTTTGKVRSSEGIASEAPCNTRHALHCIEK
jgi:hypothetical protein